MKEIKVIELFAGVGGFRIGLEGWNGKSPISGYSEKIQSKFKVIWSNQWEPSTNKQEASDIYEKHWGKTNHVNKDITTLEVESIPEHDMLVGGFPCQDYSVARPLIKSKGIEGKKGVLWWTIYNIIQKKENKPKILLLENVDRLLISPSTQKGRDFAIILSSLNKLGYAVEWRIINAAEYGMPQKRKRVFILAFHNSTNIFNQINNENKRNWILKTGVMANSFPIIFEEKIIENQLPLDDDIYNISESFNKKLNKKIFENAGLMINGVINTIKTKPKYDGIKVNLKDILITEDNSEELRINEKDIEKWLYVKGAKKINKINSLGIDYTFAEGKMSFPDPLDRPSRTIITGEGSSTPTRTKHVVETALGLRRLNSIEIERLNMFPDNHTKMEGVTNNKRAYLMGNALVIGVVEKIAQELQNRIN